MASTEVFFIMENLAEQNLGMLLKNKKIFIKASPQKVDTSKLMLYGIDIDLYADYYYSQSSFSIIPASVLEVAMQHAPDI